MSYDVRFCSQPAAELNFNPSSFPGSSDWAVVRDSVVENNHGGAQLFGDI